MIKKIFVFFLIALLPPAAFARVVIKEEVYVQDTSALTLSEISTIKVFKESIEINTVNINGASSSRVIKKDEASLYEKIIYFNDFTDTKIQIEVLSDTLAKLKLLSRKYEMSYGLENKNIPLKINIYEKGKLKETRIRTIEKTSAVSGFLRGLTPSREDDNLTAVGTVGIRGLDKNEFSAENIDGDKVMLPIYKIENEKLLEFLKKGGLKIEE